jgi:UDP-N-acetylmuramoyl-tripeptide--D-alanyl-D-alanine ligase
MAPDDLFFAIRGERYDGAEFLSAALEKGAAGVVAPRWWKQSRGRSPVIVVDDTTAALQALANTIRRDSGTKVVAITGSAGKTTTKEVTSELLSSRFRVIRNRGNLNNHIGLPLSLIELRHRPDIAVVELGMNHVGEIGTLVRVAEPDVRVWTNVGEAHLAFFDSVDGIADAKAEIFEGAGPSTLLVSNADDDRIMARARRFGGRLVSFGIERNADVRALDVVDRGVDGLSARVVTPRGSIEVTMPLVGRGNLANLLAATAVALEFDIPLATIAERASRLTAASHRGEVVRFRTGLTLVDDSYNANPTATERALDVLVRTPAARRVAILGEMLELGGRSTSLHENIGRAVARKGIDVLYTIGGAPAAAMADAAVDAGMPRSNVRHFGTSEEAAAGAVATAGSGDVVLVKGSRGVRTDLVVERLRAEHG